MVGLDGLALVIRQAKHPVQIRKGANPVAILPSPVIPVAEACLRVKLAPEGIAPGAYCESRNGVF